MSANDGALVANLHVEQDFDREIQMSETLITFARRLQQQSWNRPGTDKTWVLQALWQHQLFAREVRSAERVATG